ncbi:Protein kinase domain-containing protein [Hirschfeldia incana]|nr:Protein kinase domain-containing protein [Hirschfeldia incana]
MASKITAKKNDDSDYEIIEGESKTALAAAGTSPWIDSATLELRHRIGRGLFGDVWLATHHQSAKDYEVAIKMLHPINKDQMRLVVDKFKDLVSKSRGMENFCILRGVSIINGRICLVMNFCEGCVGDKMARLKEGRLPLSDVLRYGVDLVKGILELHAKGFLILNLKPSNFLLSDNDKAILGDVGFPYLLHNIPLPSSDMIMRLGTPNYMAPEQWQPEVRGPVSFETDSWGFGCSIVEMLTGVQPWSGKSIDEIYNLVVIKREKLSIPNGIPPPLEKLLQGCFMYDLRSRPSITDILHVLKSLQNTEEEEFWSFWRGIDSGEIRKSSVDLGYTKWLLSKDQLQVGDTVRSRKPANLCKHENMDVPEGKVVGLERETTDSDGFALVKVHGVHDALRVHVSVLQRVTNDLASRDWVRLKYVGVADNSCSPVGIVHSINREGNVAVGFMGSPNLWRGTSSQLQIAKGYSVGQFVKIKANVFTPRFNWICKDRGVWATGRISHVLPNGCLEVEFPGVLPFGQEHGSCLADPVEVEIVDFSTCEGVVEKYQHLQDLHWAVRPLLAAMEHMASKITAKKNDDSDYKVIEGESKTASAAAGTSPWIYPTTLKLRHRIGRGPFGDVWLATHHQSTNDYEVAIKMLHPINKDQMRVVVDKLKDLVSKSQGMDNVCLLRGVSIINGRICLLMNFYEGCVGDKMARLRGGKLSLSDVLRYGVELATGILELHAKGFLILNLKPSNFLLSDNDKAILGDVGVPYLLHSIPLPSSDMIMRLGTPDYMAPEQWQPEVRGPVSFETDSWGFGCSIVEMLTGVKPWSGKSIDEMYNSVVIKREKLTIPNGIPPPLEKLLQGCFMYDLRSRPSMTDILHVLKSLQNTEEEEFWSFWRGIDSREIRKSSADLGYTEWFLSKDQLQVGDTVRSRKPANSCKHENMDVPEGKVVGLERDTTDSDGFALVKVLGVHDALRVHVSVLERVTDDLAAGDWVRLKYVGVNRCSSPVGIVHSIDREGNVAVGFIGSPTLWRGTSSQLQMAKGCSAGQFVKIRVFVVTPRFKWKRKDGGVWATGKISHVLPNGCLEVEFPGVLPFGQEHGNCLADPAEVETVDFSTCEGLVGKFQHLEDFHWVVRPLLIAVGVLTAVKLGGGLLVGKKVGRSKNTKHRDGSSRECVVCQIPSDQDRAGSDRMVSSKYKFKYWFSF